MLISARMKLTVFLRLNQSQATGAGSEMNPPFFMSQVYFQLLTMLSGAWKRRGLPPILTLTIILKSSTNPPILVLMKPSSPITQLKVLIMLLSLSLSMLPLLGLHIHLPGTHHEHGSHTHQAETHIFHLHTSGHDNIDNETGHPSDTPQVNLDIDTRLGKIFQFLGFIALACLLLVGFITVRSSICCNYSPPCLISFQIYRDLIRGPPASLLSMRYFIEHRPWQVFCIHSYI